MNRRRLLSLVAGVAAVALLAGCGRTGRGTDPANPRGEGSGDGRVRVVTTIYPLYFFARTVGGDRVDVVNLVPAGAEPHDWEPRASDIRTLESARMFIYNGAGFEPWVGRVLGTLENRDLIPLDASAGLDLLPGAGDTGHGADTRSAPGDQGHGEAEADPHGAADPHVWLDPVLAQRQVQRIAEALAQADPAGQPVYAANARALMERLAALDREYQALSACPRREVVVTHAFFGYPARRYGLEQVPIVSSLSPEGEPTPKQLADLVAFVRERNIRYIFVETLVSDRVARTLAKETGAEVLVLNPIEGLTPAEEAQGKDYFTLMRENLVNLKQALGCGTQR